MFAQTPDTMETGTTVVTRTENITPVINQESVVYPDDLETIQEVLERFYEIRDEANKLFDLDKKNTHCKIVTHGLIKKYDDVLSTITYLEEERENYYHVN